MTWALRWRLSAMMFLQYAIWGAWAPVLTLHLKPLLLNDPRVPEGQVGVAIGLIFGTMPLATIISPLIAGQIVDRYFATQRFLAAANLAGAVLLFILPQLQGFRSFYWLMMAYALIYAPTVALTNSLAFHHLPDRDRDFPAIRLWGTVGWVAAGWLLGVWLGLLDPAIAAVSPGLAETLGEWRSALGQAHVGQALTLAGVMSVAMAVLCLVLPHTPPSREAENPWAFLGALRLLKQRNFAVLIIVSFAVATELGFYYMWGSEFFKTGLGLDEAWVSPALTIGQIAEAFMLALLALALKRLGVRTTIAIGIAAWPLRYLIFAAGHPAWLVIASQALHGVCWAFFFAASYVYVDSAAGPDIRGSAQSLITLVTSGLGMWVGNLFAGKAYEFFDHDFHKIFLIPVAITAACLIAFLVFFRPSPKADDVAQEAGDEQQSQ